ncbi:MAG TPA: PhzF family phenazine biosynthesis protein, partial [Actinobacteria bacterium]|nr:PhzF family phenazine biosynthesis protein [Actinomycetota bacterium]
MGAAREGPVRAQPPDGDAGVGGELRRFAAFTDTPRGGNPAGVWIGPELPTAGAMQRIAAEVGFSETVFLTRRGSRSWVARYHSPEAEVPFCGHATIAAGVVLGVEHGPGIHVLATRVGDVPVAVDFDGSGRPVATLTSVEPARRAATPRVVGRALEALGWAPSDLDPSIPPAFAYAGSWHLVLAVTAHDI